MEGKLIKSNGNFFTLYGDKNQVIATSATKLSIKNCEAITNGYDLIKLIEENSKYSEEDWGDGFLFAMNLMGDKKFSEDDIRKAIEFDQYHFEYGEIIACKRDDEKEEFIQSLQQTEWDVEICCYIGNGDKESDSFKDPLVTNTGIPKLDTNGCLILKRI